jgi:ABC-2 type transport system ATP-binding protein
MSEQVIELRGVEKSYRFFQLRDVGLELAAGQILGFVGPNGAGKSTTIRILMGLVRQERGEVRVLGHEMPREQAAAKRDIGFVSDDMSLYPRETLAWHMGFVAKIYAGWDPAYAQALLRRFNLHAEQRIQGLSHGERVKAALLLVLARRPRLLVLDEPTAGLDPVARHEVLAELMEALRDERRAILFSSHNTQDVEQISDQIAFIDRGRIIDASDKETFLESWRRLHLELPAGAPAPALRGAVELSTSGRLAVATTNVYSSELEAEWERAGAKVREVQRMTLEEIFVANVMRSRGETAGETRGGEAA